MPISYMVLSSSGRSLPFPRNGWADKREQGCHTQCKTLTLPIASANSVSIDHWSGRACCCFHIHIESMNKIKTEKDYTPPACPWKLLSQVKYMSFPPCFYIYCLPSNQIERAPNDSKSVRCWRETKILERKQLAVGNKRRTRAANSFPPAPARAGKLLPVDVVFRDVCARSM